MKTRLFQFIAALCLPALTVQAHGADTLIFDNSELTGYVFQPAANREVLDYAVSPGGLVSKFAFYYSSGSAGTVRVSFYTGTDNTSVGLLLKQYTLAVAPTVSPQLLQYTIPEADRFELPAGAFGYSFETSLSSFRVEMAEGGTGITAGYWLEMGGTLIFRMDSMLLNLSFQLLTGPPQEPLPCRIIGQAFNDFNRDGIWDLGEEPVISGRWVYLDANNDSVFQQTELSALTGPDGFYVFEDLPSPAVYRVRQVLPDAWEQTIPSAEDDFCYVIDTQLGGVYDAMLFGSAPLPVKYGGGSGTSDDPYQIHTPAQLNNIALNPDDLDSCFILMADLDMTGVQYNVIGGEGTAGMQYFTGEFNGNRHVIRNLRCIRTSAIPFSGLFGAAMNAVIYDLGLENVDIASADGFVGGLVGYQIGGFIDRCFVTGRVQGTQHGSYFGGLAGYLNAVLVSDCRSDVDVRVASTLTIGYYTGGFAGMASHLVNCFSSGPVVGPDNSCPGGLTGNQSTFGTCCWDIEASGQTTGGGVGRTTAEMRTMAAFAGWDFETTWRICEGMNYPRLAWEPVPVGDFVCPEGVEVADILFMADQWLVTGPSDADIAPAGQPDGAVNLHDLAVLSAAWLCLTD